MASPPIQPNTSWLPAFIAAQENHDLTQADDFEEDAVERETPRKTAFMAACEEASEQSSLPPPKRFDAIEKIEKLNASTVPLVSDPGGDTWIFIDPPSCQPNQDADQYKAIREHFAVPHCLRSKTLRDLNSPLFNAWLRSTPQHRIQRRRGLVGKLPHHIKYVIDLTPQLEGDEGAHLLSQLMCPDGVRTWLLATSRWDIPPFLIGGKEDYSNLDAPTRNVAEEQTGQCLPLTSMLPHPGYGLEPDEIRVTRRAMYTYDGPGRGLNAPSRQAEYVIPASYTGIRHHCAIERVLNVLVDNDPKLDSAPKVWTTFVMAKHLGVASHVNLNNYIIRWLRANRNMSFLDVMPELCLEMADGLQNFDLCREAFALLVGERALESAQVKPASLSGGKTKISPVTIHGRKKYDISEAYETRLEYAYTGFREMIFKEYATLVQGNWIQGLPEFQRIADFTCEDPAWEIKLHELRCLLIEYVCGSIVFTLRASSTAIDGPFGDRSENNDIFPTTYFATIWEGLTLQQRLLTRSFWTLLFNSNLSTSASNIQTTRGNFGATQTASSDYHIGELEGERLVDSVTTKAALNAAVDGCTKLLATEIFRKSYNGKGRGKGKMVSGAVDPSENIRYAKAPIAEPPSIKPQRVLSHRPAAKRPKHESSRLDDGTRAYEAVTLEAENLPFVLRASRYEYLQDQSDKDFDSIFGSPDVSKADTSRSQPPPPQPDQFLGTPPHKANLFHTAPPFNASAEQVNAESSARLAAASQLQQGHGTIEYLEHGNRHEISPWGISSWDEETSADASTTEHGNRHESSPWGISSWDQETSADASIVEHENRFFNLTQFLREVNAQIGSVCARMLDLSKNPNLGNQDLGLTNVLCCLTDNEWKYLPLWAGGNDDGSGGVFDDEIPIPDAQFMTAGPKVFSSGSSSSAASSSSGFDMVSRGGSTRNTSTVVQDGFSDTLDRHRTYAASMASDSPSTVGRLASQLGEYDMLSDVTADDGAGHEEEHEEAALGRLEARAAADLEMEASAVAVGESRADLEEEPFDDVFDSGGEDTEGEGEDQEFEDE